MQPKRGVLNTPTHNPEDHHEKQPGIVKPLGGERWVKRAGLADWFNWLAQLADPACCAFGIHVLGRNLPVVGRSARGGVVMPGIPTSRHILEDQIRSASMTTSVTQNKTLRQARAGCPEVTTNSRHFKFKAWRGAEYGAFEASRSQTDAWHLASVLPGQRRLQ